MTFMCTCNPDMHTHVHTYTHIYTEREKERGETKTEPGDLHLVATQSPTEWVCVGGGFFSFRRGSTS